MDVSSLTVLNPSDVRDRSFNTHCRFCQATKGLFPDLSAASSPEEARLLFFQRTHPTLESYHVHDQRPVSEKHLAQWADRFNKRHHRL